jgi:hypothetical protein
MRNPILHIALASMIFFLTRPLSAQQPAPSHGRNPGHASATQPAILLKATVDKQKILIGQPIQLMLEATVPGDAPLTWPSLDSLPHFEWMEKGKIDSVSKPEGRYYRQYLTVTSFDSGAWAIPQLPFIAGNKKFLTDSVRIEVGFTKFDASKDYHDIKDIIDVPNPFSKWYGWIVAAVTLLSLALVIWLIRKKKLLKGFSAVEQPRLSPYEEAVTQLAELEKQRLPESGAVKTYYTRLNDVIRLFVLRKLGIASLAETNEELIGQLRPLPLTPAQFDALAETLRMSDFVKFAKYQPGLSDNENDLSVIRNSVELLNKIGEERDRELAVRAAVHNKTEAVKLKDNRPGEKD